MTTTNTYGRQVVAPLTNKSGGGVIAGDVVVVDTTNNDAFTTSTAGAFTGGVGIAQETIASNATGRVLLSGYAALVNTSASVTRGNFGKTHTVAKQAVDAGASRTAGTFCQFLTGGTTPDAVVYPVDLAAAGGAGALTLLEQHTASSSATLDFTTCITSTYDDYMFELIGIVPATDSAMLTIRCSTDGGATYDSGSNYASVALAMNSTGTASGYGRTTTSLSFHDDTGHNSLSSSGLPALAGSMHLYAPLSASNHKRFTWNGVIAYYSGGGLYQIDGSGTYLSTTATNAVRFLMSSGNIASGIIRAYGIAKS